MKRQPLQSLLIAAVALEFAGAHSHAQERAPIELKCVAFREVEVVEEEGEKRVERLPADRVLPGDTVVYIIECSNRGNDEADNIVINNPVPENMTYKADSATGPEETTIEFSVDGGKTFAPRDALTVVDEEGRERPAEADDITAVRWILTRPLQPAETIEVSFEALLE